MADGPTDIAEDQIDQRAGRRGEPQDAHLMVDKDRPDAGARQQVVHVIIGARQIADLGLQLGIDRRQFFVDRLQLLLGGFQLLVGRLQFLIHRLHFLVGRFEFFVRALQFLVGTLQVFVFGTQFFLQRRDAKIDVRQRDQAHRRIARGQGRIRRARRRRVQDHQIHRRFGPDRSAERHRAHGDVDPRVVAVRLHVQPCTTHDLFAADGFVQSHTQITTQPLASHVENIADSGLARNRLQVEAGTTVQIEDVALAVNQRAGHRKVLQQRLFGHLTQGPLGGKADRCRILR